MYRYKSSTWLHVAAPSFSKDPFSFSVAFWHRVKYGLDYFLDHFLDHALDHFLDHFKGEEHTISTEGGVGWDEVYQF